MEKDWIPIMIKTGKLKMSFTDWLTHYLIVFFCFIPLALYLFFAFKKHILHNYKGVRSPEETLSITIFFTIVGVIFYFIQNSRLKFNTIEIDLPKEKLKEIIKQTAKELEWHTYLFNEKIVVAKTNPKWWTGSWGEQITIIIDGSRVLINSICDPSKKSSVVSLGRNKRNVSKLIENLKFATSSSRK